MDATVLAVFVAVTVFYLRVTPNIACKVHRRSHTRVIHQPGCLWLIDQGQQERQRILSNLSVAYAQAQEYRRRLCWSFQRCVAVAFFRCTSCFQLIGFVLEFVNFTPSRSIDYITDHSSVCELWPSRSLSVLSV